jgi:hypothetical protein
MVPSENHVRMSGFISPQILPLFTERIYFKDFESLTSGHGFLKGIKNIFDIHLLTAPTPTPTPSPVSVISQFRNSRNLDLGPHITRNV